MVKYITKLRLFWLLLGSSAIVASFYGMGTFALCLIAIYIALLLDTSWPIIRRLFLSVLIFFSITHCLTLATSFLHVPLSPGFISLIYLVPLTALLLFRNKDPYELTGTKLFGVADLLGLIAAVVIFLFLFLPFVGKSTGERLRILSRGEDNASHIALYKNNIIHAGYIYFTPVKELGVIGTLTSYPQGTHNSMAIVTLMAQSKLDNNHDLVRNYAFLVCAIFSLLSYFLFTAAATAASHLGSPRLIALTGLVLLPVFYTLFFGNHLYFLYIYGFQSQILAYAYLLSLILLLLSPPILSKYPALIIYTLLTIGLSFTWYFLLPLAMGLLGWAWFKSRSSLSSLIVVAASGGTFISAPVLISLLGDRRDQLNVIGGVMDVTASWIAGFTIITFLLWLTKAAHNAKNQLMPLYILFLLCGIFTLFIGGYQMITAGKTSYYFVKSLYTFSLTGFIALFCLTLILLRAFFDQFKRSVRTIAVASLIALMIAATLIDSLPFERMKAEAAIPGNVDAVAFNQILRAHPWGLSNDQDIVFAGSCDYAYSYINTRWTGALYLIEDGYRGELSNRIISRGDEPHVANTYLRSTPRKTVQVISHSCRVK